MARGPTPDMVVGGHEIGERIMADIGTVGPWITAAKDVVFGGSAALAAYFAYLGLSTWRDELKGRAEYQLAKDTLKAVYKVRDAFKHVRNPVTFISEYPEHLVGPTGPQNPKDQHEAQVYAYQQRFQKLDDAFQELEDLNLDAQVEWGPEFSHVIEKLRRCRVDLLMAVQSHLREMNPQGPGALPDRTQEQIRRQDAVLYDPGGNAEPNEFDEQINEAVAEFEPWLRPHVEKRG